MKIAISFKNIKELFSTQKLEILNLNHCLDYCNVNSLLGTVLNGIQYFLQIVLDKVMDYYTVVIQLILMKKQLLMAD